jgi:hypothetical protein
MIIFGKTAGKTPTPDGHGWQGAYAFHRECQPSQRRLSGPQEQAIPLVRHREKNSRLGHALEHLWRRDLSL